MEISTHLEMLRSTPASAGVKSQQRSMFEFADDSMCKACRQSRLTFEPPSLFCTCCGQRIKRNQVRTGRGNYLPAPGTRLTWQSRIYRFAVKVLGIVLGR